MCDIFYFFIIDCDSWLICGFCLWLQTLFLPSSKVQRKIFYHHPACTQTGLTCSNYLAGFWKGNPNICISSFWNRLSVISEQSYFSVLNTVDISHIFCIGMKQIWGKTVLRLLAHMSHLMFCQTLWCKYSNTAACCSRCFSSVYQMWWKFHVSDVPVYHVGHGRRPNCSW